MPRNDKCQIPDIGNLYGGRELRLWKSTQGCFDCMDSISFLTKHQKQNGTMLGFYTAKW